MSDNRNLNDDLETSDYNSLTTFINYKYSIKNNYDFVYYNPLLDNKIDINNCLSPKKLLRHSSWSKLLSTIQLMSRFKEYNYIVYLDSDCIFNRTDLSIEDYLRTVKTIKNESLELKNKIIFMNNKPWNLDLPCAGFYILPNNDFFINFIVDWYNNEDNEKFNLTHPWEQMSLQVNLVKKYYENIEIIDDWMFREKQNQFLRHIGSEEKQNRIPFFKQKILQEYNIEDYILTMSLLKNKIQVFDTNKINIL